MNVTAVCERSGDWWAVSVPEVDGAFTQAKRLDQVPAMVADAVALLTGTPADQISVTVDAHLPDLAATLAAVEQARELEAESRRLQDQASRKRRIAVGILHNKGFSTRDIGLLTGVSYQRVSQVLASLKGAVPTAKELQEIVVGPSASTTVERVLNPPTTTRSSRSGAVTAVKATVKAKGARDTVTH